MVSGAVQRLENAMKKRSGKKALSFLGLLSRITGMRYLYLFLTIGLAFAKANAGTFQISSNLDNSFMDSSGPSPVYSTTIEAPYVGALTLTYDAANALANGSYALDSLSNFQLSVLFSGANNGIDVTFDQTHLDFAIAGIYIQVVDGDFFFTNSGQSGSGTSLSGSTWGGAANFINGGYLFTTQPLDSATRMGFGGYVVKYNALYQLIKDPGASNESTIYTGNYGNPTDNLAVPEPSALSLLAVGLGGLALVRRRRS